MVLPDATLSSLTGLDKAQFKEHEEEIPGALILVRTNPVPGPPLPPTVALDSTSVSRCLGDYVNIPCERYLPAY